MTVNLYEKYLEKYNQKSEKDGLPGYENTLTVPLVSKASFYYTESGQLYKDIGMLERTMPDYTSKNIDELCEIWWFGNRHRYGVTE